MCVLARTTTEPRPVISASRALVRPMISPPVGKVRPRHDLQQLLQRQRRVVDQRQAGVDDLAQIVRRDVGGHAHRDSPRAIDQQVRNARRQNHRLLLPPVVVGLEVDRVLLDVGQERGSGARHAALGVAHAGRRIAVDRAEVPLAVDERHAHGERLRHAHQGVVDRLVAVRVEAAQHVADHARALGVALVGRHPELVHRVQDAAVHGLQTVARVRKRARDDHAHGVVEVGSLELVLDADEGDPVMRGGGRRRVGQAGLALGRIGGKVNGLDSC
jgi:hypothetical protein